MNLFSIFEKLIHKVNKYSAEKILLDCVDFKILAMPLDKNFTILVQGPIFRNNFKFFSGIICEYLKVVGEKRIIVSATSMTPQCIDFLKEKNIRFVVKKPKSSGPHNIFYQASSVLSGLNFCTDEECIVKVRNDQFIQRWDFIDAYKAQVEDGKVFAVGFSFIDPAYHIGDMVHWCKKELMEKIWNNVADRKNIEHMHSIYQGAFPATCNTWAKNDLPPEIYIGISLSETFMSLDLSLDNYYRLIREKLILCSNYDVGLQWAKHNAVLDFHRVWTSGYRPTINHIKWLQISRSNKYEK
ncbi:hypothetical protein ICN10_06265 [Polynucleobacter sp. 86C-FISCH]|uniref:hypothetical protein n=1 Tax=Polynucleobacter sp. 86C-FISCH TaxID=2689101 RepID=UPI001C0D55DF|nr:hypothetical protein [Polynucleobacter sp. 86C-FISCH]MBU3596004.1 hypothetical protein [Polynucleobacter sp. 86C-FISCH]